jgi:dihydrofolate synthase/folylpolyglutamate synthase
VIGMLANRYPATIIEPLESHLASVTAVPIRAARATAPRRSPARAGRPTSPGAAGAARRRLPVLIAGSLYLAGKVLAANGEVPD